MSSCAIAHYIGSDSLYKQALQTDCELERLLETSAASTT